MTRRAKFKFAAALLSIAIGLVLAESLVGRLLVPDVFLQRAMRDGGVLVPYHPGAEADLLADEFRVRFRINRHGHRDRLDREEARDPRKRVLLLGDSFSAGWGVEFEETYGFRIEATLGVEVVNAARSGGCPLFYVPQLRALVPRFQPDLLLVQIYDNDPDDNLVHRERLGVDSAGRFVELPDALRPRSGARASISRWVRGLKVRHAWRAFRRKLASKPVTRSPFVRPGARAGHKILSRAQAIAAHDVDLSPAAARYCLPEPARSSDAFALQRTLVGQLLDEAIAAELPVVVLYVPNSSVFLFERPLAEVASESPHGRLLRDLCAARGVSFVDGTLLLGAHPRPLELYFAHDGHLNRGGHAVLAKALARELPARIEALR